MPTVEELMTQGVLPGCVLAGGGSSTGRQVSWAVRLRGRAPAFDRLSGGEAAVIPRAAMLAVGISSVAEVIDQLAALQVSAVISLGDVQEPDRNAADLHRVPLLVLPEDTNPEALELRLQRWLLDAQLRSQHDYRQLQQQLTEAALSGAGVEELAERLARITRGAVVVQDAAWAGLFNKVHPESGLPAESVRRTLELTAPSAREWAARTHSASQSSPARFDLSEAGAVRLVAPVPGSRGSRAFISLILPEDAISEHDAAALSAAASAATIALVREHTKATARAALKGDLIESLLSRDYPSEQVLHRRALHLGYSLQTPYAAVAIRTADVPPQERLAAELEALGGAAPTVTSTRDDMVFALVPIPPSVQRDSDLLPLARQWHQTLQRRIGAASMGLGSLQSGPAGLGRSLTEAGHALSMTEQLYGQGSFSAFTQLGLANFLLNSFRPEQLQTFHDEALGPLAAYDTAHGTELLPTLEAYFQALGSVQAAADRLSLHRNSLLYRLQRIESIAGVDLDDPEVRLRLQLALWIRRLLSMLSPVHSS